MPCTASLPCPQRLLRQSVSSESEIGGQDAAQPRRELRVLEPQGDRRLEKAELVAAIEALAVKAQPMEHLAFLNQLGERIGQLDLATAAGFAIGEVAKDFRLDDITTNDGQRRRCHCGVGLFDYSLRPHQF